MNQIRCPHCNRKIAEFSLFGSLVFKTKCPKCNQMVELSLRKDSRNGAVMSEEQTA